MIRVRWVLNVGWSDYRSVLGEKYHWHSLTQSSAQSTDKSLSPSSFTHLTRPSSSLTLSLPFLPSPLAGNLAKESGLPKSKFTLVQVLKCWYVYFVAGARQYILNGEMTFFYVICLFRITQDIESILIWWRYCLRETVMYNLLVARCSFYVHFQCISTK